MTEEQTPDLDEAAPELDEAAPDLDDDTDLDDDADSFPRDYVEKIRAREATYRTRARDLETRTEDLTRRLFAAQVEALGLLADPDDMPYDPELVDDPADLAAAVDELLQARPHYKRRGNLQTTDAATPTTIDNGQTLLGLMRGT